MSSTVRLYDIMADDMDELITVIRKVANKINAEEIMSLEETAEMLHMSTSHLKKIKHRIGFSKPEGTLLFKKSDVTAYINKHHHPPI